MQWVIGYVSQLTVCECERGISSIELQLVRVETCGSAEGHTKEGKTRNNVGMTRLLDMKIFFFIRLIYI